MEKDFTFYNPDIRENNRQFLNHLLQTRTFEWRFFQLAYNYLDPKQKNDFKKKINSSEESIELPEDDENIMESLHQYFKTEDSQNQLYKTYKKVWGFTSITDNRKELKTFEKPRELLERIFKMNDEEIEIMIYFYATIECPHFNHFLSHFNSAPYYLIMSELISIPVERIKSYLREDSQLSGLKLLTRNYLSSGGYGLTEVVYDIFFGVCVKEPPLLGFTTSSLS